MKISTISAYSYVNQKNSVRKSVSSMRAGDIAFKGALENNLKLGREVLKEFLEEFPSLKSSTTTDLAILHMDSKPEYRKLVSQLKTVSENRASKISSNRSFVYGSEQISYDNFMKNLRLCVKDEGYANCGEMSLLMQDKLFQKGVHSDVLSMGVYKIPDLSLKFDHSFPVVGLERGANMMFPESWSDEAVMVDAWAKKVMPVKEAVEFYKELFKAKSGSIIRFSNVNQDPRIMLGLR